MSLRFSLLLAVVLLALGASEARAEPFGPMEEQVFVEAEAYWGGAPPLCGEVQRSIQQLAGTERGAATQPSLPEPTCVLVIDSRVLPYPGALCIVMTHEVGHLWGLGHSTDPDSVMYPEMNLTTVPRCLALEEAHNEALWRAGMREHCEMLAGKRPRTRHVVAHARDCWSRFRLL